MLNPQSFDLTAIAWGIFLIVFLLLIATRKITLKK